MRKTVISRGTWLSRTVLACTLLSACGGGGDANTAEKLETDTAETDSITVATQSTITFHMTGLVLIVPPATAGGTVHALMPDPRDLDPHDAVIGFGIPQGARFVNELCFTDARDPIGQPAIDKGICYANLDDWLLDSYGDGGTVQTPTMSGLPATLLNVSDASGGTHGVHFPAADAETRSKIAFLSGRPGQTDCTLATWRHRRVKEPQLRPVRLASVVSWEVKNPTQPDLVFRLKAKPDSVITVTPPASGSGEIAVLLAHIPHDERRHLPPHQPPRVTGTVTEAIHFNAYYNLLSTPAGGTIAAGDTLRRLPREPNELVAQPCRVRITTEREGVAPYSLATYACMPASGTPG